MSPRTLKRAIAFIDRNVDDLGTLLAGISPHVEPILLSDDEPAPRQMVRAVKGRADLDAIHVIAHGRPGEVSFGAGALSLDTTDEHAAELAEVGRMLRGGAIHLWTCETARGRRGAAFIEALARASGAPIAASTQRVGAAAGGGRWQLDARPGAIHASAPLTAQGVASYAGVMATQTITSGGPALSLSISSTIFTDHPSPHAPYGRQKHGSAITSGGLTNGSTLALTGTVSDANGVSLVQVYDGATLLGTATLLPSISGVPEIDALMSQDSPGAQVPRNWAFVTPALLDGSHSFTVTATDNAGNTTTTSAVTAMVDTTPPSVISVSSRETGDVVHITLNMSEEVTVSGTPGLLLNDGGTATYATGSGTQALTFEYTVPSNQGTSDLRVIGDTLPSPTAIQDLAGNAADLSAAGADLQLKVGSTTTTTTSVTLSGTQQTELFGPSSVNVTFASGATGTLILDASSQFTGTIAGLSSVAPFDTIDLADIAFGANTTVVYLASSTNTGTLTVSDGTHTANIALSGQYSPTSFKIASDGHGGTAVVDPLLSTSGSWSGVFSWPIIGLQSLLTPDGKILSYGTDQAGNQGALIYDVWDPITNTHNTLPNPTHTDEFCAAAEIIPETGGEVLLAGGDARPLGSVNTGVPDTNIFDYKTDSVSPNPSGPMAFGRWYPTLITLDTGQLLILGGRDFNGNGVGYPEIFTPGNGWRTLTGAYVSEFYYDTGSYPRAWQSSNGKVITFATNASGNVYAIDPSGNGQVSVVGHTPQTFSSGEPAIMYAQDHCLILGSDGSVWLMDISGPTPVFTQTGSLPPDRIWSNLTNLPDGRVMVSGGSQVNNQLTGVDYTVAIWDPSTGLWTSTGANAAEARLYHSTAILLPDDTILSLGGGAPGPLTNLNGEIYTPGYLFDANGAAAVRPVIQQAPLDLSPGQTFTVRVDNPANIRNTLALMPFGSTTHGLSMTAGPIDPSFSVQADGSLSVTLPAFVPPGYWMLFAIGNNGTPSIAWTLQVHPAPSNNTTPPTISGTVENQHGLTTTSEAPVHPFAGVTISDPNTAATDTLTITLSNGGTTGTLSGSGLSGGTNGVYTLAAAAAATITSELDALVFTPKATMTVLFNLTENNVSNYHGLQAPGFADPGNVTYTFDGVFKSSDRQILVELSGGNGNSAIGFDLQTGTVFQNAPFGSGWTSWTNVSITADAASGGWHGHATIITPTGAKTITPSLWLVENDLQNATYQGDGTSFVSVYNWSVTNPSGTNFVPTDLTTCSPFNATTGAPGSSTTTTFTLSDLSSADATPTVNSSTTVINTDPAGADQDTVAEAPVFTSPIPGNLTVTPGGSIALGINAAPVDSDDNVSVKISGVPKFEQITAPSGDVVTSTKNGPTYTYTISAPTGQAVGGLTLISNYTGPGHPTNALTVSATNSTAGEAATSVSHTINVTDPPAATSTLADATHTANIALLGQYMAASFVTSAEGFGGTLIHDDPPPGTLAQTLTQPQHA